MIVQLILWLPDPWTGLWFYYCRCWDVFIGLYVLSMQHSLNFNGLRRKIDMSSVCVSRQVWPRSTPSLSCEVLCTVSAAKFARGRPQAFHVKFYVLCPPPSLSEVDPNPFMWSFMYCVGRQVCPKSTPSLSCEVLCTRPLNISSVDISTSWNVLSFIDV